MSIVMEINPFNFFTDTNGDALDAGYVYIGEANKDPRQYPVAVYYDLENTIPAAQPLRTSSGYIVRNGSPTFLFVQGNYSVMVRDSRGRQIYYVPDFLLIGTNQAVTFNDLSNTDDIGKGDALIGVKQPFTGSVSTNAHNKFAEVPTVKDAGAKGDGVTDDLAAINAMGAALGYVIFGPGNYLVGDGSIAYPMYFQPGAYLTLLAGSTLVMSNRTFSSKQWIFRGEGTYRINIVNPNGEDARDVHVSWFGAFPTNTVNTSQVPYMQKAFDAFAGQNREGRVIYDIGSYHMAAPGCTVPRGVEVACSGTRRTVFDISGDGYVPFTTAGDAVKFTNLQFEQPSGEVSARASAYVQVSHAACEIYNIWLWNGMDGIIVEGANCKISGVNATYGVAQPAGSAAIRVRSNGCSIDDIQQNTSAFGPTALVDIGGGASSNIGFCRVTNIQHACPSISVAINANNITVSRVNIDNVMYAGLGGTSTPALVKTLTSGTGTISNAAITGLNASSLASSLVRLEQNSTGVTEDIIINNSVIDGVTGNGIEFVQTAGTMRRTKVGDSVDVSERATPYFYSGTISSTVEVSPMSDPAMGSSKTYPFSIANDSAVSINFRRSVFSGSCILTAGSTNFGQFVFRAAPSPAVTPMFASSANVNTALSVLTGTTGASGKFTLGVQPSTLYLENRLGTTQDVTLNVNI